MARRRPGWYGDRDRIKGAPARANAILPDHLCLCLCFCYLSLVSRMLQLQRNRFCTRLGWCEERRRRSRGWLSGRGGRWWGRARVFRHRSSACHVARMQRKRLKLRVCRCRIRICWRSLQCILPRGGARRESHRRRGAKGCSWEDLESMCDRFIGSRSVEHKQPWCLRSGCRPATSWDVAKDKAHLEFLVACFLQSAGW